MEGKINETLKKLLELSEKGIGGEKENATILLNKLMKKYNITEEDLMKDDVKEFLVKYKTDWEQRLINQIVYMINPTRSTYKYRNSKKKVIILEVTDAEFIEFNYLYKIYHKAFEKDLEIFMIAFVQKNGIFPKEDPNSKEPSNLTSEEYSKYLKAGAMAQGIEHTEIRKALN